MTGEDERQIFGTFLGYAGPGEVVISPSTFSFEVSIEPDTFLNDLGITPKLKKVIKKKALKAKKFLKSWLTASEYKELQKDGLTIPSKIFLNRTYKVKKYATKMVEVYDNGRLDHKLCAIDRTGKYENDDTVLAKILMLKTNEHKFLKIAERYRLHPSEIDWVGRRYRHEYPDGFTLTWTFGSLEPEIQPIPSQGDSEIVRIDHHVGAAIRRAGTSF